MDQPTDEVFVNSSHPVVEFFVQAIPCYIFFAAFNFRYHVIKQLGFPRPISLTNLQLVKITFTTLNMLLYICQLTTAAFTSPHYPCTDLPGYLSLFYLQFIAAHMLSLYLLFYQHWKRLPEVNYCHHLFWVCNLFVKLILLWVWVDFEGCWNIFSIAGCSFDFILFICVFKKQRVEKRVDWYQRPLLVNDSDILETVPILERIRSLKKKKREHIEFKIGSKIKSNKGQCFFEIRVILPSPQSMGSNNYTIHKSMSDFIALSSQMQLLYPDEIPHLEESLFESRILNSQRMMARRVKTFQSYLNIIGRHKIVSKDEIFLEFIELQSKEECVKVPEVQKKSKAEAKGGERSEYLEMPSLSSDVNSLMIFDKKYTVIDNFERSLRDAEQGSLSRSFSIAKSHQSILNLSEVQIVFELSLLPSDSDIMPSKEVVHVVQKQNEYSVSPTSIGNVQRRMSLNAQISQLHQEWDVVWSYSEIMCFQQKQGVSNFDDLNSEIAKKGASILTLFFINYFKIKEINPKDYVEKLLNYRLYYLLAIDVVSQNIEIEEATSVQYIDLKIILMIEEFKREEVLYLKKSYAELKRYFKSLFELKLIDKFHHVFQRKQYFFYCDSQMADLVSFFQQAMESQLVLKNHLTIEFLSEIEEPAFAVKKLKTPMQSLIQSSWNGSVFNQREPLNQSKTINDSLSEEASFELRLQSPTFHLHK